MHLLECWSVPGRNRQVEATTNSLNSFTTISGIVTATNGMTGFTDTATATETHFGASSFCLEEVTVGARSNIHN